MHVCVVVVVVGCVCVCEIGARVCLWVDNPRCTPACLPGGRAPAGAPGPASPCTGWLGGQSGPWPQQHACAVHLVSAGWSRGGWAEQLVGRKPDAVQQRRGSDVATGGMQAATRLLASGGSHAGRSRAHVQSITVALDLPLDRMHHAVSCWVTLCLAV